MSVHTLWVSCGVVRAELEALHQRELIEGELLFLDSMLHMHPPQLEARLAATLEKHKEDTNCLILIYGDCSAHMLDMVREFRVGRVPVINCAQLLVGSAHYRQLMREGAFMVLPEWARRWEHIIKNELGLNHVVAPELMGENRSILVYLDTGLVPVPEEKLQAFSSYIKLPWRVEAVPLDCMLGTLLATRNKACLNGPGEERV